MTTHKEATRRDAPTEQPVRVGHCDACGAMTPAHTGDKLPEGYWGDVLLCTECGHTLTVEEIEDFTQEFELRGVPFS